MKVYLIPVLILVCTVLHKELYGQENGSVGIGIENPNPNAILHLVSPGSNQGLLVPSLTTTQRTATSFISNLSGADNGLLVFDINQKAFYYWQDNQWVGLSSGNQTLQYNPDTRELTISGGNTINLGSLLNVTWSDLTDIPEGFRDGIDNVDDADADPENEIQDLEMSGTILRITNNENATAIDLGNLVNTEKQSLSFENGVLRLSGDPASTIVDLSGYDTDASDDFDGQFSSLTGVPEYLLDGDDVEDADADPTNELQTLSRVDNSLTLSHEGGTVSLEDDDSDPTNELLTGALLQGTVLNITDAGGTIPVELNSLIADADADPTNELQTISRVDNSLTLSHEGGTVSLEDGDADPTNELLTGALLEGTVLNLTDAGGTIPVELSTLVDDADADPTNELQTLSRVDNSLTLSHEGGTVSVEDGDADPTNEIQVISTDGTSGNISLSDGGTLTLNVDDLDSDPNNEIQNLAYNISTNELRIRTGSVVNSSVFLTDLKEWSVVLGVASFLGDYANANNFISTPSSTVIQESDLASGILYSSLINFSKVMSVYVLSNATLANIDDGVNGQELTLIAIGEGTLTVSDGGNINMATASRVLENGDSISLIYYTFTVGDTTYKGWTEK